MNATAEALMCEVRVLLGRAALCERRGEVELADAFGAVAGNKVARVDRMNRVDAVAERRASFHVVPLPRMSGIEYAEAYGEDNP